MTFLPSAALFMGQGCLHSDEIDEYTYATGTAGLRYLIRDGFTIGRHSVDLKVADMDFILSI